MHHSEWTTVCAYVRTSMHLHKYTYTHICMHYTYTLVCVLIHLHWSAVTNFPKIASFWHRLSLCLFNIYIPNLINPFLHVYVRIYVFLYLNMYIFIQSLTLRHLQINTCMCRNIDSIHTSRWTHIYRCVYMSACVCECADS